MPLTLDVAETTRVVGFVAVFDDPIKRADGSEELIRPGAFTRAIKRGRLVLCLEHDRSRELAQQADGTLQLRQHERGLWVSADIGRTSAGRALLTSGRRSFGASFAFSERTSRVDLTAPPRRARILADVDCTELSLIIDGRPAYRNAWLSLDDNQARVRARWERLRAVEAT